MKKKLLILLTVSTVTYANENYLGLYSTTLKEKTLHNKYCKENQRGNQFCMEYTLSYPITIESKNRELKDAIEIIVQEKVKEFKKLNAKNKVLALLSDEPNITWSWEDKTTIELFATTQKTFTLAIINYNYSGGAHANRVINYQNYDIESGDEVEMSDIFTEGYENKLYSIANRFYRKRNKLSETDSLTKVGWYGDDFILSNNFAITSKGLEFLYNPYEIKPHSAGITRFFLPYNRIESILKERKN